jgi:pimeloyl-ACP methyl ester carboxylesterase
MTELTLAGPAGSLHVVDIDPGADATPVVFAHAFAGSSIQWAPQLDHAGAARRAVAFDFHGHGRSEAAAGSRFDVGSFVEDIAAVADGLDLERFVLVGHSLGGAAAIAYAAERPDRVAGLVLVGTPGRMEDDQVAAVFKALDADYDGTMSGINRRLLASATPATRRTVEGESERMPETRARRIIAGTFAFDPVPPLEAYAGPKLTVSPPQEGPMQPLHQLVAGVDHETVEGTSHWIQLDDPERFDAILDAFLARVDTGTASRVPAETAGAR